MDDAVLTRVVGAAERGWRHARHLIDYTYGIYPDKAGGGRYRPGFRALCGPKSRRLPVDLRDADARPELRRRPRAAQLGPVAYLVPAPDASGLVGRARAEAA